MASMLCRGAASVYTKRHMRWDKKAYRQRLRHRLKQLRAVKTWQLLVVLLFASILSATFLRLNNLNMIDFRHAVISADEKGDAEALKRSVNDLQRYVSGHMNTSLGDGFYLTASYERAREAAMKAASDASNPGSALYQQASVDCQTERFRVAGGYVQCVLNKVRELGGPSTLTSELKLPRSELYKIDFASPVWSLDPAGLSVAFSIFIILLILARLTGVGVLRLLLKQRFSSIS